MNKEAKVAARIFGISRHRLTTDGEGVTTLVAFNGCPLRCKYCLNKASWETEKGRAYTPEMLFEEVKIDQLYFLATHGGITFGGGEPLLQVSFIKSFRELCGNQWQLLAETSLNVPFENVEALDAVLDGYIVDIKDMNPEIYKVYTGKDNAVALSNLQWLLQHGDPNRITVRVPHIPDFNVDEDVSRSMEQLKTIGVVNFDEFNYIIR
ncbi:MAG: radical SAM protein [Bacteroidales bacterium]|nr:radical SAM protein [Bacteroidales bacterium]